jgi:hypothetical protein
VPRTKNQEVSGSLSGGGHVGVGRGGGQSGNYHLGFAVHPYASDPGHLNTCQLEVLLAKAVSLKCARVTVVVVRVEFDREALG